MKKRSLAHAEKQEGTPSKQARLNFSGGLLTVTEDMGLPARNMGSFFNKAIVPLKGTSWESKISFELNQPYMRDLFMRLDQKVSEGKTIYPPVNLIFNAFVLTPFDRVRVVIIGQDPYHNPGQAHGLSFSVPPGVSQPPSLKNIFKELSAEYPSFKTPKHGSLVKWAMQGVFLLNATLTVEQNSANSHKDLGWQKFSDSVIKKINDERRNVVFLLWGQFAQKKAAFVDLSKHAVVKTAHPSPLSYRYFEGCGCFKEVNASLCKMGQDPIDWSNL